MSWSAGASFWISRLSPYDFTWSEPDEVGLNGWTFFNAGYDIQLATNSRDDQIAVWSEYTSGGTSRDANELLVVTRAHTDDSWSAPQVLDSNTDPNFRFDPQVVASNGNEFQILAGKRIDRTSRDVVLYRRDDIDQPWDSATLLPAQSSDESFALFSDGHSREVVIYNSRVDSSSLNPMYVMTSSDGGDSWGGNQMLDPFGVGATVGSGSFTPTGGPDYPDAVVTPGGEFVAAWMSGGLIRVGATNISGSVSAWPPLPRVTVRKGSVRIQWLLDRIAAEAMPDGESPSGHVTRAFVKAGRVGYRSDCKAKSKAMYRYFSVGLTSKKWTKCGSTDQVPRVSPRGLKAGKISGLLRRTAADMTRSVRISNYSVPLIAYGGRSRFIVKFRCERYQSWGSLPYNLSSIEKFGTGRESKVVIRTCQYSGR